MNENEEILHVCGVVEDVIYKNDNNGYIVLELDCGSSLITVQGILGDINEGEELSLTGRFVVNAKYGRQFKAETCERSMPATAAAIQKYLGTGVIKGLGVKMAKKIVDRFGERTFDVIENEHHELMKISGINKEKANFIHEEFKRIFSVRTTMLYLSKYGVNPSASIAVWKKFGNMSVEAVSTNPYELCAAGVDLPFEQADKIAGELGFEHDNKNRVKSGLVYILKQNSFSGGHTCIPLDRFIDIVSEFLGVEKSICVNGLNNAVSESEIIVYEKQGKDYAYLPEYFRAEQYTSARIAGMLNGSDIEKISYDENIKGIEWAENIKYEKVQKKAIELCLSNRIFILTGGPGTGKTTTLNAVIQIFKNKKMNVVLAAPTGRAAKRLTDLTNTPARTIHRVLGIDFAGGGDVPAFMHHEKNPLDADAVIVDEMSMVDILLFDSLLRALKDDCRFIMVGDSNQLPSVGAGNVLRDLISSGHIPTVELKEIFRQAAESLIVTNAHMIVNGKMPVLNDKKRDFFFMYKPDESVIVGTVVDLCKNRLPKTYKYTYLDDIQVLSPTKMGPAGTKELNKSLQAALNPPANGKKELKFFDIVFRVGDKVMQIKNDYDIMWKFGLRKGTGIFNGDIGFITDVDRQTGSVEIDFEGRIANYTLEMLQKIELAYAVTIHKSQGSEYNAVIMALPGGFDKLMYRNLLYTAVTRAKKIFILLGTENRVQIMVENDRRKLRYSCLKAMLDVEMGE